MAKRGQIRLTFVILLLILFSFLVFATTTTTNQSDNVTDVQNSQNTPVNVTTLNESIERNNVFVTANSPEGNNTNLSILIQREPETVASVLAETAEDYKDKLNKQTKDYLQQIEDPEEEETYIVKFKNRLEHEKLKSFSLEKEYTQSKTAKIQGKAAAIQQLLSDTEIKYLEIDQEIETLSDSISWNVEKTNAPAIWGESTGSDVKVAILDSGIGPHDDLQVAGGWNTVDDNDEYQDTYGHGTMVAGVAAALLNDEGLVGASPDIELHAVKIFESSNGDMSDALAGIEWAVENNMDIVSMSFALEGYSQIFKEALEEADDAGILFVAAAGNDGTRGVRYPAAYSSVIAVGAIDEDDERAGFSNYGFELELVAPGVMINSTKNDGYSIASGTSMAAPHVAAVAALIQSYNESLSSKEIRAKLQSDALDLGTIGKDDYYGYGLVQANLSSGEYNYTQEIYYYEIYNITAYGTENETYEFWLNGNGTIDDIDFLPGYYHVLKKLDDDIINQIIEVDETGAINLLYPLVEWDDAFTYDEDDSDWISWEDDLWLSFQYYESYGDEADVICVDYDFISTFDYEDCWSAGSTELSDCRTYYSGLNTFCTGNPGSCSTSGRDSWHNMPSSVLDSRDKKNLKVLGYYDCAGSAYTELTSNFYYVIDHKKTECDSSTVFNILGQYDSSLWVEIENIGCGAGKECDTAIAGNYTASTYNYNFRSGDNYPCRNADGESCTQDNDCLTDHYCACGLCSNISTCPNVCNGTIDVLTEDRSGKPLGDLNIYLNDDFSTITESIGTAQLTLTEVGCDAEQYVTVKCADNSTICGTQSTQIDLDGDVDSLSFDCTPCSTDDDLYFDQSDVIVDVIGANMSVTVHSVGVAATFDVTVVRQDGETLTIEENETDEIIISSGGTATAMIAFDSLGNDDLLHIYIDSSNDVPAEDNSNNYLLRPAFKSNLQYYLDIRLDESSSVVEEVIRDYLSSFIDVVENESAADAVVKIGSIIAFQGFANSKIVANGRTVKAPHGGVVESITFLPEVEEKNQIHAYGLGVEGVVAAVKRLVNSRRFFDGWGGGYYTSYIEDTDPLGVAIADLMHNAEAETHYAQNDEALAEIVHDFLFDNNFELSIMPAKTLNTTSYGEETVLRVKHVNTDFSDGYLDAFGISSTPVVFSGGLFSSLTTWEEDNGLARQMANEGWDVWEIEMTGGPNNDCDDCPNYYYQDLVDHYWPASIAAITEYSGQNSIDYVGHSNGCRAALSSLNEYSNSGKNGAGYYWNYDTGDYASADLPARVVNRFMGVACPSVLNEETSFTSASRVELIPFVGPPIGQYVMDSLSDDHMTMRDFAIPAVALLRIRHELELGTALIAISSLLVEKEDISHNLMNYYINSSINDSSTFDVNSVNVTRLVLFNGKPSDLIVPMKIKTTYIIV